MFLAEMSSRLLHVRQQRNLTQEKLAESANISSSYYSQVEGGLKSPSAFIIASVAKALGVSADYILYGHHTVSEDAMHELLVDMPDSSLEAIIQYMDYCRCVVAATVKVRAESSLASPCKPADKN